MPIEPEAQRHARIRFEQLRILYRYLALSPGEREMKRAAVRARAGWRPLGEHVIPWTASEVKELRAERKRIRDAAGLV